MYGGSAFGGGGHTGGHAGGHAACSEEELEGFLDALNKSGIDMTEAIVRTPKSVQQTMIVKSLAMKYMIEKVEKGADVNMKNKVLIVCLSYIILI